MYLYTAKCDDLIPVVKLGPGKEDLDVTLNFILLNNKDSVLTETREESDERKRPWLVQG